MYQITKKGKKRWLLIDNMNKYNRRLQSSRGLDFEVDPRLKEIAFHNSTRDPYFYQKMVDNFAFLSKEKGRPPKSVYFKGDTKLSRELSHFLFSMICVFLDAKKGKISRKLRNKALNLMVSEPYISELLKGNL